MRQVDDARPDPAPSRLRYRLERLLLTPLFRFVLRVVVPFGVVFGAASLWVAVPDNRAAFQLMVEDLRAQVESRPELQVNLMAIDGASPDVAQRIRDTLALSLPISSLDLDLEDLQDRIVALDPVESASLRMRSGGVLQVDVAERRPVMLWRTAGGLILLDGSGARSGVAPRRADFPALPVIAGTVLAPEALAARAAVTDARAQGARAFAAFAEDHPETLARAEAAQATLAAAVTEARALFAAAGPLHARLRGFERRGARRWDVVLDRGQRILLPEAAPVRALERAIAMHQVEGVLGDAVVAVDLRLPRRPTLRLQPAAAETLWQSRMGLTPGEPQP